jgi:hypothetical protein
MAQYADVCFQAFGCGVQPRLRVSLVGPGSAAAKDRALLTTVDGPVCGSRQLIFHAGDSFQVGNAFDLTGHSAPDKIFWT